MDRAEICKSHPISTLMFALYVKEVVAKVNFKGLFSMESSFSGFFVSILLLALLVDVHLELRLFSHRIVFLSFFILLFELLLAFLVIPSAEQNFISSL